MAVAELEIALESAQNGSLGRSQGTAAFRWTAAASSIGELSALGQYLAHDASWCVLRTSGWPNSGADAFGAAPRELATLAGISSDYYPAARTRPRPSPLRAGDRRLGAPRLSSTYSHRPPRALSHPPRPASASTPSGADPIKH